MIEHCTLVVPYYDNPGMLEKQYEVWRSYPQLVKERIDVILVDDGPPRSPAVDVPRPDGLPPVSVYRVLKDIPWNQHGARNLGAKQAKGPWLLMTDMDHIVPTVTWEALFSMVADERDVYTFSRIDAPNMTPTVRPDGSHKPHPNSFCLTKKRYWKAGGYDEDYCGMYGTDGLFRARLYEKRKQVLLKVPIIRVPREVVPDASTTTLVRRENGSVKGATRERTEWKIKQGRQGVIVTLNFPWERQI